MNGPQFRQPRSAKGGAARIDLNIDELIIRGVAPGDRDRLVEEIKQELSRLLAEGQSPSAAKVSAGQGNQGVAVRSRAAGGESVARQIAGSIYQAVSGGQ